jgi:outer membrane protein TolC
MTETTDRGRSRLRTKVEAADRGGTVRRAIMTALVFIALMVTSLVGQQVPQQMTLEDAIGLAKANNPTFLSTQNDEPAAGWRVREAYAQFLPRVSTGISGTWQAAGEQRFGTVILAQQNTDWVYSGYGINLNMTIDGNTIFGIPNARANRRATTARVEAAEFSLESTVAFQYMAVLRAQEGVDVTQRQLDRARQNLQIVTTRVSTGAAAGTDGKQAEVDLGRAEVALIQAQRDMRQARLLLAEQLGVPMDEDVRLSSEFEVFEPDFDVDGLLANSQEQHPSLNAFRAQEDASRAAARQMATSQYLPSLSLSARFSGQAQEALNRAFIEGQLESQAENRIQGCEFNNALITGVSNPLPGLSIEDCSQLGVTPQRLQEALAANNAFPFDFTRNPATLSAQLSLPVFTGFSRQRQVADANNAAEDAEHNRRAEELRLRTMVTNTFDNLVSAYRVVQAEARNRTLAEEQLLLQQRRYALGAVDLLVLMDAQTTMSTAEQAHLNAVYDFHYNLIALEAAVGQPLRPR